MSELQSDAFADDLSTDQEDAWRNEETAAASEANLFQKVKEEPETEYLGPEEEPAVDSGRSVESRPDFGIFAEEGKLDNTSSGHIFREEPITEADRKPCADRKRPHDVKVCKCRSAVA